MNAPIALVTGASGAIGPTLVTHLMNRGYIVRTLSRSFAPVPTANFLTTHFCGAITDTALLDAALENVATVFHLAALLHIEKPQRDLIPEYYRINEEGSRLVAERSVQAGVRRLVYFSTVKVYGSRQRQPITEDFPPEPKSIYALTKLLGEQAIHAVSDLNVSTLRLSPVYGPHLRGSWERLVRAIARGRFLPIGDLGNTHSLTHVDDVARAALIAAEHPEAAGKIYNLVGHESPTMFQILDAIYSATDKSIPRFRVPASLALLGTYALGQALRAFGKESPLSVEGLRQLISDEAYSGQLLRSLGFNPIVDISEGWTVSSTDA